MHINVITITILSNAVNNVSIQYSIYVCILCRRTFFDKIRSKIDSQDSLSLPSPMPLVVEHSILPAKKELSVVSLRDMWHASHPGR